jgi:hypothetical protein
MSKPQVDGELVVERLVSDTAPSAKLQMEGLSRDRRGGKKIRNTVSLVDSNK